MESAALPKMSLLLASSPATLRRRISPHSLHPLFYRPHYFTRARCCKALNAPSSIPPLPASLVCTTSSTPVPPLELRAPPSISASPGSGDGGGGQGGGGGGGGGSDGGSSGGEAEARLLAEEVSDLGEDIIILSVGGMSCGGCARKVKSILESQPQVSSVNVNLEKETAVVWVVPEAKVTHNWQQQLGEVLANHLTTCGFNSSPAIKVVAEVE